MKTIDITEDTYARLEQNAKGFSDTPEMVIRRLLDFFEGNQLEAQPALTKPELTFFPDERAFTQRLLQDKRAEIVLHRRDGSMTVHTWNASRFTEKSNLRANLWSGYLRDWQSKDICAAELSSYPNIDELECDERHYTFSLIASTVFNIPFNTMVGLDFACERVPDGLRYDFSSCAEIDIINRIEGLSTDKTRCLWQNETTYPLN